MHRRGQGFLEGAFPWFAAAVVAATLGTAGLVRAADLAATEATPAKGTQPAKADKPAQPDKATEPGKLSEESKPADKGKPPEGTKAPEANKTPEPTRPLEPAGPVETLQKLFRDLDGRRDARAKEEYRKTADKVMMELAPRIRDGDKDVPAMMAAADAWAAGCRWKKEERLKKGKMGEADLWDLLAYSRVRMLQASKGVVDADPEGLKGALDKLQEVAGWWESVPDEKFLWVAREPEVKKQMIGRAKALRAVTELIRAPAKTEAPADEKLLEKHRKEERAWDYSGLMGIVLDLYARHEEGKPSKEGPPKPETILLKAEGALAELLPPPEGHPRKDESGATWKRWSDEGEGVVAWALAAFLESLHAVCSKTDLKEEEYQRHLQAAQRYRAPPAVQSALAKVRETRQTQDQVRRINAAFAQWTAGKQLYGFGDLQNALEPYKDEKGEIKNVPDKSRRAAYHLYVVKKDIAYRENPQNTVKGEKLDLASFEPLLPASEAKSAVEKYARAVVKFHMGQQAAALEILQDLEKQPLQPAMARAVRFYKLCIDNAQAKPELQAQYDLYAGACDLCEDTRKAEDVEDQHCLETYQALRDALEKKAEAALNASVDVLLASGRIKDAVDQVAKYLKAAPPLSPSADRLRTLVARAVKDDQLVDDAGTWDLCVRARKGTVPDDDLAGNFALLCAKREWWTPSPAEERRRALAALSAPGAGQGIDQPVQRYRQIQKVINGSVDLGDAKWRQAALLLWLRAVVEAAEGRNDAAPWKTALDYVRFLFTEKQHFSASIPESTSTGKAQPGAAYIQRVLDHFLIPGEEDPDAIPGIRDLLQGPDPGLGDQTITELRRKCYPRLQTLRARAIARATKESDMFAELQSKDYEMPGYAPPALPPPDATLANQWKLACEKLKQNTAQGANFLRLARETTVQLPREEFAELAMTRAMEVLKQGGAAAGPEAAAFVDAVAEFLKPLDVAAWDSWGERFVKLAEAAAGTDKKKEWMNKAIEYLAKSGKDDANSLYRRACYYFSVGNFTECRKTIADLRSRGHQKLGAPRILGAACALYEAWNEAATDQALAAAIGEWCKANDPQARAPYWGMDASDAELLDAASDRKAILLALLCLARTDWEKFKGVEGRLGKIGEPKAAGEVARDRELDALADGERQKAGVLLRVAQVRQATAGGQKGEGLKRWGDALLSAASAPSGAAERNAEWYQARFKALAPAFRPDAAGALYEGHAWEGAEAGYRAVLQDEAEAKVKRADLLEACRRWVESDVRRQCPDPTGKEAEWPRLLKASLAKIPAAAKAAPLLGEDRCSRVRQLAAEQLLPGTVGWKRNDQEFALAEDYWKMIHFGAKVPVSGKAFSDRLKDDPDLAPYVLLWWRICFPLSEPVKEQWLYRGKAWPWALHDWYARPKRQDLREGVLDTWCKEAPDPGSARDRRAEAFLVSYLKRGGPEAAKPEAAADLKEAIETFAIGNPEYSLAVILYAGAKPRTVAMRARDQDGPAGRTR